MVLFQTTLNPVIDFDDFCKALHYDLFQLEFSDGFKTHIPVPILMQCLKHAAEERREKGIWGPKPENFALSTTWRLLAQCSKTIMRTRDFFKCPGCGCRSFFQGMCQDCLHSDDKIELHKLIADFHEREAHKQRRKHRVIRHLIDYDELPENVWDIVYVLGGGRY